MGGSGGWLVCWSTAGCHFGKHAENFEFRILSEGSRGGRVGQSVGGLLNKHLFLESCFWLVSPTHKAATTIGCRNIGEQSVYSRDWVVKSIAPNFHCLCQALVLVDACVWPKCITIYANCKKNDEWWTIFRGRPHAMMDEA